MVHSRRPIPPSRDDLDAEARLEGAPIGYEREWRDSAKFRMMIKDRDMKMPPIGSGSASARPLPTREEILREAMPAIREAVIEAMPDADKGWQDRVRNGLMDEVPVVRCAIAGWLARK